MPTVHSPPQHYNTVIYRKVTVEKILPSATVFNILSTQGRVDNATGYFAESKAALCLAGLRNMFDEKVTSLFGFFFLFF